MYQNKQSCHNGPENFKKPRPKKLVKSNISIIAQKFREIDKFHFTSFFKELIGLDFFKFSGPAV